MSQDQVLPKINNSMATALWKTPQLVQGKESCIAKTMDLYCDVGVNREDTKPLFPVYNTTYDLTKTFSSPTFDRYGTKRFAFFQNKYVSKNVKAFFSASGTLWI